MGASRGALGFMTVYHAALHERHAAFRERHVALHEFHAALHVRHVALHVHYAALMSALLPFMSSMHSMHIATVRQTAALVGRWTSAIDNLDKYAGTFGRCSTP